MCNLLSHQDNTCTCHREEERAASGRHAVAAASAAPTPAKATVAATRTPGTKKSPPIAVTKRTYLTKHPYKRQKKAAKPAAAPGLAAAPAPAPLVEVNGAAVHAPLEKKPPPSPFLPCPLWRPCPFCSTSPSICVVFLSRL